jgi:hypothetical protein
MCGCHEQLWSGVETPTVSRRSIREQIYGFFFSPAHEQCVVTATDVAATLSMSLSSVSSTLRKMVLGGDLLRVSGFGPRGGYGYLLPQRRKRS